MERRYLLQGLAFGVGSILLPSFLAATGPKAQEVALDAFASARLDEMIAKDAKILFTRYGIPVDMTGVKRDDVADGFVGEELGPAEKQSVLSRVRKELAKYPPAFVTGAVRSCLHPGPQNLS